MKWTQEQREKAKDQLFETRRDDPEERIIGLTCQRNELLKVAQLMVTDEAFADLCEGIGEEPRWLKMAREAVAKAEAL